VQNKTAWVASLVVEQKCHRQVQRIEGFERKKDAEEIACALKRETTH
jgi:hypothetical protein